MEEKKDTIQEKLDKYVSREVRLIAIVVAILGFVYFNFLRPLSRLEHTLDFMRNNEMKHTEESISEIRKILSDEQKRDLERDILIQKILTTLEKHDKD